MIQHNFEQHIYIHKDSSGSFLWWHSLDVLYSLPFCSSSVHDSVSVNPFSALTQAVVKKKNLLWVLSPPFSRQTTVPHSVVLCFFPLTRHSTTQQSHFSSSHLKPSAGERDQSSVFMPTCASFMWVVSLILSLTLSLLLCFRSVPGANSRAALPAPTDISKLALLCLGRLLQYNGIMLEAVGGIPTNPRNPGPHIL